MPRFERTITVLPWDPDEEWPSPEASAIVKSTKFFTVKKVENLPDLDTEVLLQVMKVLRPPLPNLEEMFPPETAIAVVTVWTQLTETGATYMEVVKQEDALFTTVGKLTHFLAGESGFKDLHEEVTKNPLALLITKHIQFA